MDDYIFLSLNVFSVKHSTNRENVFFIGSKEIHRRADHVRYSLDYLV